MSKRNLLYILASLILSACQKQHLVVTHNTPYFKKGNKIEGSLNGGISGINANLAYSPVKYLQIQSNACYFTKPFNKALYNQYIEGAFGAYVPFKKSLIAVNGGYGVGATAWIYDGVLGQIGRAHV